MESINWIELIIAMVATYGALLSTYTLVAARKEKQRRVAVTLTWGLLGTGPESSLMFFLTASNPGNRAVTLASCHLLLPNGKSLIMPRITGNFSFPHGLEEGKNCMAWFPVEDVIRTLISEGYRQEVSITAVYTDALGTNYMSKAFSGNLADWVRAAS